MKRTLIVTVISLVLCGTFSFNETQARSDLVKREHKVQEFEVTFEIVYNAVPLEKATAYFEPT